MKTWFKTPLGALIDLQVYRSFRIAQHLNKVEVECYFYPPVAESFDSINFDTLEQAVEFVETIHSLLDPSHKPKKTKEAK